MHDLAQLPIFVLVILSLFLALCILMLFVPIVIKAQFIKKGTLIKCCYKITWLGITMKKKEMALQSTEDFISEIIKLNNDNKNGSKTSVDKKIEDETIDEHKDIKRKMESEESNPMRGLLQRSNAELLLGSIPGVWRINKKIIESIDFQDIYCHLTFGLNDPCDTAIVSGYFWFIKSMLESYKADVSIEPCFEGEKLEMELNACLKTRLFRITAALLSCIKEEKIRKLLINIIRGT